MNFSAETSRFLTNADPLEIVRWALSEAQRPVLSTNFRPLSVALLHLVSRLKPDIPVIWVDTGYKTEATYEFVEAVTTRLDLNLQIYAPRVTVRRRETVFGGVPEIDSPQHDRFTEEVKLEPFRRALSELEPDVWFTGIRREQNAYRSGLGIVSTGPLGTSRVAPLFHWSENAVAAYIADHHLPDNDHYYDPTKGPEHRECGLQLLA